MWRFVRPVIGAWSDGTAAARSSRLALLCPLYPARRHPTGSAVSFEHLSLNLICATKPSPREGHSPWVTDGRDRAGVPASWRRIAASRGLSRRHRPSRATGTRSGGARHQECLGKTHEALAAGVASQGGLACGERHQLCLQLPADAESRGPKAGRRRPVSGATPARAGPVGQPD